MLVMVTLVPLEFQRAVAPTIKPITGDSKVLGSLGLFARYRGLSVLCSDDCLTVSLGGCGVIHGLALRGGARRIAASVRLEGFNSTSSSFRRTLPRAIAFTMTAPPTEVKRVTRFEFKRLRVMCHR